MSSDAAPISATRFAEALKDLPLSTLHLKAIELRNSIAHLDYSNEQLQPFASGADASCNGRPDPDCVDAIRENEIVIKRQQERIALLKGEVEGRGSSWLEFQTTEEVEEGKEERLVNGTGTETSLGEENGEAEGRSSAWSDGTFQTGRIVNGEFRMDEDAQTNDATNTTVNGASGGAGGRLDDEALRRAMEERMRDLAEGDDGGMHL